MRSNTVVALAASPRAQAAATLAALIHAAEASIDAASVGTAALTQGVIDARRDLSLSSIVGAKGEAAIARAGLLLAQAKLELAEAHGQAARLAKVLDVPVMVGPLDKPEDDCPIGDGYPDSC